MELSFWDTDVIEKYSKPGNEENHKEFKCGGDAGGITNSYEFERGE
jgi:hypothetical protein